MKVKLSGIPVGSCFLTKKGEMKKKVGDRKIATVALGSGKVRMRKVKTDPEVEPSPCELRYFGVGMRMNPETLVQIGDGNLLKNPRNRR